jgi:hypothetical protein
VRVVTDRKLLNNEHCLWNRSWGLLAREQGHQPTEREKLEQALAIENNSTVGSIPSKSPTHRKEEKKHSLSSDPFA